jgi:mycofactocin precursor
MTQIVTDCTDVADDAAERDLPTVGAPPVETHAINVILDDDLVEDVSIDGMCGVY